MACCCSPLGIAGAGAGAGFAYFSSGATQPAASFARVWTFDEPTISTANEGACSFVVPYSCLVSQLVLRSKQGVIGAGNRLYTVRLNGVNTALSATLLAFGSQAVSGAASFAAAQGALLSVLLASGTLAGEIIDVTMRLAPT